ncbi:tetratricopeptide repeat protein [Patescibacteria group bacterium]|nr:tetratricopeptide repeat protein [Patescibacteria group bacterium]
MSDINIVIKETEVSVEEATASEGKWERISYYLLLALAFILPFGAISFSGFSLSVSKFLLVFVFVLLSAIFYLMHILQDGKFKYPKSTALLAFSFILLVVFVSSLFSFSFSQSFFGIEGEIGTFVSLFILAVAMFLASVLFRSEEKFLTFFFLLIISSLIVFVYQLLHLFLGVNFWGFLPNKTDTLVGNWNELGIFFGLIALISIFVLESFDGKLSNLRLSRGWRIFLFIVLGVSVLTMIFVNFTTIWLVLGFLLLIFLVYLFSFFKEKRNFVGLPLSIILISLFFILAQPIVADLISVAELNMIEVRPSWSSTIEVVEKTLSVGIKNIILGSGPNTFSYDWIKFKPAEINQTIFWNTRFPNGIGFLPTLLATTGVLGILGWLVFLGSIIYYGVKTISHSAGKPTMGLLFGSFLASLYLWVFAVIYVPGNFLMTLTFLVTGLFLAMLVKAGFLKMKEFSFADKASLSFIFSLLLVFVLIGIVGGFYAFFQKYLAVYSYAQGIEAFNSEGNLDKAETCFLKAARFNQRDVYYRALSELGLIRLSLLAQGQLPQEEARAQFQNILAATIQNAQIATDLNKSEPLNWMALGNVYANIIPFGINGAREAALAAYGKAMEAAPTDPQPFFSLAQTEVQSGNNESARSYLSSALDLKGNYTSALFLLAGITAQEGDLDNAIKQTEVARLTAPNDMGVLFQLGMLYYQKKDYDSAQRVLERIVVLNSNYSNARYFLGLIYDKNGDKKAAIEQFKVIQSLNPDNDEVKKILNNLKNGNSALFGISPPMPAPEKRENPPVEE